MFIRHFEFVVVCFMNSGPGLWAMRTCRLQKMTTPILRYIWESQQASCELMHGSLVWYLISGTRQNERELSRVASRSLLVANLVKWVLKTHSLIWKLVGGPPQKYMFWSHYLKCHALVYSALGQLFTRPPLNILFLLFRMTVIPIRFRVRRQLTISLG